MMIRRMAETDVKDTLKKGENLMGVQDKTGENNSGSQF